jgi:glutaredoxin-related protein
MSIASAYWLMLNDPKIYVIDVDVLARIHIRKDSKKIYDALIAMAQAGTLRTVRQTFDELKRFGTVNAILKDHRENFQISAEEQFHEDVSALIEILGNEASYL